MKPLFLSILFSLGSFHLTLAQTDSLFFNYFPELPEIGKRVNSLDKKQSRDEIITRLLNSGRVNNEDVYQKFLNEQAVNMKIEKNHSIHAFNSNRSGVFSQGNKIFVTTGLLARLNNEKELQFFIFRELARISSTGNKNGAQYLNANSFNKMMGEMLNDSRSIVFDLDRLGAIEFRKNGGEDEAILSSLLITLDDHQPYLDVAIHSSVFEIEGVGILPDFFNVEGEKLDSLLVKTNYYKEKNRFIDDRLNALSIKKHAGLTGIPSMEESFRTVQRNSRIEYVRQAIVDGDYEVALYCLSALEMSDDFGVELVSLRDMAWYGLALKRQRAYKNISGNSRIYREGVGGKKTSFFFKIRQLSDESVTLIAARKVHMSFVNKETDVLRSAYIWNSLRSKLSEDLNFNLDSVELKCKQRILEQGSSDTSKSTINDFVLKLLDSEQFRTDYSQGNVISETKSETKIIVYPFLQVLKNGEINIEKSASLLSELRQERVEETSFSFGENTNISIGEINILKQVISENFSLNRYESKICSVDDGWIDDQSESNYSAFVFFQKQFKPKFRGYYAVGLLGVTLPFVAMDMILKANDCAYLCIVIENTTGNIMYTSFSYFNEPLLPKMMKNRIDLSIKSALL